MILLENHSSNLADLNYDFHEVFVRRTDGKRT